MRTALGGRWSQKAVFLIVQAPKNGLKKEKMDYRGCTVWQLVNASLSLHSFLFGLGNRMFLKLPTKRPY
jgi:hypothetical protein